MIPKTSIFYNYIYIKELIAILLVCLVLSIKFKSPLFTSLVLIFILILALFFRNNLTIKTSYAKNAIISPSSSRIEYIKKKGNYNKILTYLSPLDRHFMIAPTDCKVISVKNILLNGDSERVRVKFKDTHNNYFYLDQIVKKPFQGIGVAGGWLPKLVYNNRIVTFIKKGDILKRGERWGLIRFGSNMLYTFPTNYKFKKNIKDQVSLGNKIGIIK